MAVNGVVLGPFEEEQEEISLTSDVVKVKDKDPATPRLSEVCRHEETSGPKVIELIIN